MKNKIAKAALVLVAAMGLSSVFQGCAARKSCPAYPQHKTVHAKTDCPRWSPDCKE